MQVNRNVDFGTRQAMMKAYDSSKQRVANKPKTQTERKPELDIKEVDKQPKIGSKDDIQKAYEQQKKPIMTKNMTPNEKKAFETYNAIQNGVRI